MGFLVPAGPSREPGLTRTSRLAVLVAVGAVYSWWVSSTTPFTSGADVAIAVGFVLMAVVAGASILRSGTGVESPTGLIRGTSRHAHAHRLTSRPARTRAWAAAFLFLLAVELFTYFAGSGNRHDFPTVSSLYDTAAQIPSGEGGHRVRVDGARLGTVPPPTGRRRTGRRRTVMTRSLILAAWALGVLLLVSCEVLSVVTKRRYIGFAALLRRWTDGRLRLAAFFIGWMWLGWHFFAR